jgi:hypothetical protein
VKVVKRTESGCTFLIGKREREVLTALLQRYPVLRSGHFRSRGEQKKSAGGEENEALLEEALAEQQRENRRQLDEMLHQPGRFKENEFGFTFHLSPPEMEWVLQVLNDIRVGSWVELGEPDATIRQFTELNEQSMQLAWAVEMAGLFEHSLLEAVTS